MKSGLTVNIIVVIKCIKLGFMVRVSMFHKFIKLWTSTCEIGECNIPNGSA